MQYIDRLHVSIGIFKDTHFYTVLEQNTQTIFPRGFQLTDTYTHTHAKRDSRSLGGKMLKEKLQAERNGKMEQMN